MNEHSDPQATGDALDAWKETCRDLQHRARDIQHLCRKIEAFHHGDDAVTVALIEVDCRNYLTAANQRHAAMRRVIDGNRNNPHYSHKQIIELEKQAADTIMRARKAWEEMLSWVPPMVPPKSH